MKSVIALLICVSILNAGYIYNFKKHVNPELVSTGALEIIISSPFTWAIDGDEVVIETDNELSVEEYKVIINEVRKYGYYAIQEKAFISTGTTVDIINYFPVTTENRILVLNEINYDVDISSN